jgi:hypothetical protein
MTYRCPAHARTCGARVNSMGSPAGWEHDPVRFTRRLSERDAMTRFDMLIYWLQRASGREVGNRDNLVRVLPPLMSAVGDVFGDPDYAGVLARPWDAEFPSDAAGRRQQAAMQRALELLGPIAVAVVGKHPEVLSRVREGLKEIGCDKAFSSHFRRNRGGGRLLTSAQQHVARNIRARWRGLANGTPDQRAAFAEELVEEAADQIARENVTRAAVDWEQLRGPAVIDYQVVLNQARARVATLGLPDAAASKAWVSDDVAGAEEALLKRLQRRGGSALTQDGRVNLAVTLLVPINQQVPPAWLPKPMVLAWDDFEQHAFGYAAAIASGVAQQDREDVVGNAVTTTLPRLRTRFTDVFVGVRLSPLDEDGSTWEQYWRRVLGKVTKGEVSRHWLHVDRTTTLPEDNLGSGLGGPPDGPDGPDEAILVENGRIALEDSGVWDEVCDVLDPPRSWCVAASRLVEVADREHQLLKGLPKSRSSEAGAPADEELARSLVVAAVGTWLENDLPEHLSKFLLDGGDADSGRVDVNRWCADALSEKVAADRDVQVVAGVGGLLAAAAFALALAVLKGTDPYDFAGDPQ